ncbi:unnamed protein product [Closterium sp. NIES-54]
MPESQERVTPLPSATHHVLLYIHSHIPYYSPHQVTVRCACLRLKREWLCSQVQSETAKAAANGASIPTSSADSSANASSSGRGGGGGGGGRLRESMVGVGLIPCDDECRRIQEEERKRREAEEKREAERKAAAASEAERLRLEAEAAGFIPPTVKRWAVIMTLLCFLLLLLLAIGVQLKALAAFIASPFLHSSRFEPLHFSIIRGSSLLLCGGGPSSSLSYAADCCWGGAQGARCLHHSFPSPYPLPHFAYHQGFIPAAVRRWAVIITLLCFLLVLLITAGVDLKSQGSLASVSPLPIFPSSGLHPSCCAAVGRHNHSPLRPPHPADYCWGGPQGAL